MKKKRSDSSKCSAESVDLGLDLKDVEVVDLPHKIRFRKKDKKMSGIQGKDIAKPHAQSDIIDNHPKYIIEDFYKGRKTRESKLAPALRSGRMGLKVAPTIRAEHHNTADIHFVASGPMTTTNTHAKSTEKGSEQENSSREISGKSPQAQYPTMTSSQLASLVKVFPLRENVRVFKTSQGELFSSISAESYEIKDQATYSLRMLKDYFLTTADARSQSYSFRWMNLGTMWNGRCLTLNIGCPKTVKGFLSSVLEEKVNEKYYISKAMIEYIEAKTHHDVQISGSDGELKSPLRSQNDKPMTADPVIVDFLQARREGKVRIYKDFAPGLNQRDYKDPRCVMEGELKQVGNIDEKGHNSLWGRVYSPKGLAANINAEGGGLGAKTGLYAIFQRPRGKNKGGKKKISPTISTSDFEHNNLLLANTVDQDGYLRRGTRDRDKDGKAVLTSIPKRRIRRLTPRECERLQGFPDDWTAMGDKGKISDTQRYKMCGNAISCPVVTAIGKKILEVLND